MTAESLAIFAASSLLLCMAPGPDTAYILGRSTLQGRRAGVIAALGISAGILVHVSAAAFGISALVAGSANAFLVLRLIGAAYLVYLGLAAIVGSFQGAADAFPRARAPARLDTVAWQGFLTDVLNPKVALFFLAFLPQFAPPDHAGESWPLVLLGMLFVAIATVWNVFVAIAAAGVGERVRGNRRIRSWIDRSLGGVFLYLGARLALEPGR